MVAKAPVAVAGELVDALPRSLVYMRLGDIASADRNPKEHDFAVLREAIGTLGFINPALYDERTEQLVAGHGRLEMLLIASENPEVFDEVPEGIVVDGFGEWMMPVIRGWASADDAEADRVLRS